MAQRYSTFGRFDLPIAAGQPIVRFRDRKAPDFGGISTSLTALHQIWDNRMTRIIFSAVNRALIRL